MKPSKAILITVLVLAIAMLTLHLFLHNTSRGLIFLIKMKAGPLNKDMETQLKAMSFEKLKEMHKTKNYGFQDPNTPKSASRIKIDFDGFAKTDTNPIFN